MRQRMSHKHVADTCHRCALDVPRHGLSVHGTMYFCFRQIKIVGHLWNWSSVIINIGAMAQLGYMQYLIRDVRSVTKKIWIKKNCCGGTPADELIRKLIGVCLKWIVPWHKKICNHLVLCKCVSWHNMLWQKWCSSAIFFFFRWRPASPTRRGEGRRRRRLCRTDWPRQRHGHTKGGSRWFLCRDKATRASTLHGRHIPLWARRLTGIGSRYECD